MVQKHIFHLNEIIASIIFKLKGDQMISFFDFKFTYNLFYYNTFIIMKKIVIVGGGINGLVAANYLVKEGV